MHKNNGLVPDIIFMSKRLQVAAMMAQGIVCHFGLATVPSNIADDAYDMADALIAEENKEESTWQEMLIDEEKALHEKILLLDEYLSSYDKADPDGDELYDLCVDQLSSMVAYDATLNTRISLL